MPRGKSKRWLLLLFILAPGVLPLLMPVTLFGPIILLLAIIVCLVLAVRYWRGLPIDDHPVCGKCSYDLNGSPEPRGQCPECGADLTAKNAVVIGNRKRRPGPAAITGVLGLLCSLALISFLTAVVTSTNFNTYKPMWWLRIEARNTASPSAIAALNEINNRAWWNDPNLTQELLKDALQVQADTNRPWHVEWGEITFDAIGEGAGAEAEREQFIRAYLSLHLSVRPKVRIGQPIPILIWLHEDVRDPGEFNGFDIYHGPYNVYLTTHGERIRKLTTIPTSINDNTISGVIWTDLPPAMDVEPGKYELEVVGPTGAIHPRGITPTPVCRWQTRLIQGLELLPADGPPAVELIDDPAIATLLSRSHATVSAEWTEDERKIEIVVVRINRPESCDYGLAFDVSISNGKNTWHMDHPVVDDPKYFKGHVLTTACVLPDDFNADRVDVILKPNPAAAETTLDVTNILNHTIVIKDVDVEWWVEKPTDLETPDEFNNRPSPPSPQNP